METENTHTYTQTNRGEEYVSPHGKTASPSTLFMDARPSPVVTTPITFHLRRRTWELFGLGFISPRLTLIATGIRDNIYVHGSDILLRHLVSSNSWFALHLKLNASNTGC